MDALQTLPQLAPAATVVALLMLSWLALAAMHAYGASFGTIRDDNWNSRAGAAVRWAGAVVAPLRGQNTAAMQIAVTPVEDYKKDHNEVEAASNDEHFPHAA
jgi:hypothetical protein